MMQINVNTKLHFSRFRTVCKRIVGQNTFFEENKITSGVVNGFTNDLERFLGLLWLNLYVVVSIETEPAMFVYVMAICKTRVFMLIIRSINIIVYQKYVNAKEQALVSTE